MTALMLMALVISIGLGYKTKINIGFFTIAFAYLIGCFGAYQLSMHAVVARVAAMYYPEA